MAFLGSCIICLFFLVFSSSPPFWSLFFFFRFFYALDLGQWIDGFISRREMVLGLFLGNALTDMFAKCGKCEAVHTTSVCFPGDKNVGQLAERLG